MCFGDFNEITKTHEKRGEGEVGWGILCRWNFFRDALDECKLTDLGYSDLKFALYMIVTNNVTI